MSKQCEIIQDLLPLYVDGACSDASAEIIKEHLEACDPCRDIYEKMCSHTSEEILQKETDSVIIRHEKKEALKIVKNFFLALIVIYIPSIAILAFGSAMANAINGNLYTRILVEFAFLGGWGILISFPYYIAFIELIFSVFSFLEKPKRTVIKIIFNVIGLLLILLIVTMIDQMVLQYILSMAIIMKWIISAIISKKELNLKKIKETFKQKSFVVWLIILFIIVIIVTVIPITQSITTEKTQGYVYSFGITTSGSEYDGVYFSINENSQMGWDIIGDNPSITLKLVNDTNGEIKYDLNCYIYKKTDIGWELCADKPIDFPSNPYTLYSGKNAIHKYSIKGYEFKESGKYKFVTLIDGKEVWVEFRVRLENPNGKHGIYPAKYTLDKSVIIVDSASDFEARKDEIIKEYSKGDKIIIVYDAPSAYVVHATFIDDKTIFYSENLDVVLFFIENGTTRTSEIVSGSSYSLDQSIDDSVNSIKRFNFPVN